MSQISWRLHKDLLYELKRRRERGATMHALALYCNEQGVNASDRAVVALFESGRQISRLPTIAEPEPEPEQPAAAFHDTACLMALARQRAALTGQTPPETWPEVERALVPESTAVLRDVECLVASSDWQGCWVDTTAMQVRAQIVERFQPQVIAYLGDIFDMYAASRFVRDPELESRMSLADERKVITGYLDQDAGLSPRSRLWWKNGNHEEHLSRYINERAPALRSLGSNLTVPGLIDADRRRMQCREHRGAQSAPFDFHGLKLLHGTSASKVIGGNPNVSKAMREHPGSSSVFGHAHRAEVSLHMSEGRLWQHYCIGCLCSLRPGMEYVEGPPDNWAHCVLVAWWIDGRLHVELAVMQDYRCVVGGYYVTPDGAYRL